MSSRRIRYHEQELRRLLAFVGIFGGMSAATYIVPGLDLVQPWVLGEPVPLVHLALDRAIVTENHLGEIVRKMPGEGIVEEESPADRDSGRARLAESPAGPLPEADAPASAAEEPPAEPPVVDALAVTFPLPDDCDSTSPWAIYVQSSDADPWDLDHGRWSGPHAEPVPWVSQVARLAARAEEAAAQDGDAVAQLDVPITSPGDSIHTVVELPDKAPIERAAVADNVARPGAGSLRDRSPAKGTPLEVPPGALDAWFASLAKAAADTPGHIARALHWGDSTIAGDGITRTVRSRLQGRFGDGGPGFLAVQVDPRWAMRPGVLRDPKGKWKTRTITFGGAGNKYYGLGGTVSTAYGSAKSTLGGSKVGDQLQNLHRFDIAFQNRPDGGTLNVQVVGGEGVSFQTRAASTGDAFHTLTAPGGAKKLVVSTDGDGPVTVYGVALETKGPGVTWETLGVAGAGQGSMFRQGTNHLARQVAWRKPDLIVYQMGGNELGYPSLKSGGGKVWKERYVRVVRSLRRGAPDASCLLITPLDQGERVRGTVRSKPTMATMVRLQREVAREQGCAFWDAQAAMGGSGSFGVWMSKKLAWSDLYHLTNKGLAIIGNTLADALEAAYDDWRRGGAVSAAGGGSGADG